MFLSSWWTINLFLASNNYRYDEKDRSLLIVYIFHDLYVISSIIIIAIYVATAYVNIKIIFLVKCSRFTRKNDLAVWVRHIKDKISECTYVCMYFDFETKPTLRLLWQRWVVPIKNEIIFQIQAPTDVRFIMEDESKKTWDRENICKRTIYSLWIIIWVLGYNALQK